MTKKLSVRERKNAVQEAFHQMSEETAQLMSQAIHIMEHKHELYLDENIKTFNESKQTMKLNDHCTPGPQPKRISQSAKVNNEASMSSKPRPQSAKINNATTINVKTRPQSAKVSHTISSSKLGSHSANVKTGPSTSSRMTPHSTNVNSVSSDRSKYQSGIKQ